MLTTKKVINNNWWISSVITLILLAVVIPVIIVSIPFEFPLETPPGKHVKTGNRIFYNFLEQVNKKKDVIILGTSETGVWMEGQNYWNLLDQDSTLTQRFFSFGGAGRCSYVYFPLIVDNPEAFKNLNIILYINPTYWRESLNKFREDYYQRYVDQSLIVDVKSKASDLGIYNQFMKPGANFSFLPFSGKRIVNDFRSLYFHDLNLILNGNSSSSKKIKPEVIDSVGLQNTFLDMQNELDLSYNASPEYLAKKAPFTHIDTSSSFQYDMLNSFIELVNQNEINCLFYIGPINQVYGEMKNPELVSDHLEVIENIKEILEENKQPYLNGTAQGLIPGTFSDVQHISKYGAYLTAMQIKEYYEKGK